MFYLLWSGCRMSLPTFTRVHSIPKWVWCKHQNGKIKLYLSAICISGAAANTLMSACWPQFRTVKQKNLIMFSVDGRGLWLGASDQPEASDLCQSETEFQTSILNFSDGDSWRQMWGSSKTNKYCQKHNSFLFYLCSCLAKMKSNLS